MLRILRNSLERLKEEKGLSLIEIIIIIVIMGIAMLPLSRLAIQNIKTGGQHATITRAMYYAQDVMEQVIADYAATDGGRGYSWVLANWDNQSPAGPPAGLSGLVTIGAPDTLDGVVYAAVQVTVSGTDISDVQLATWIVE